jgi:hypothetical protein
MQFLKGEKTMTEKEKMNLLKPTARLAGVLFLLIFILGLSVEIFIRPEIIIPGDGAATIKNIAASGLLFRISIVSDLIRQMFIMFLAFALYRLLHSVNKNIASQMVIFALMSVAITMINELNHFAVLLLSSVATYMPAFDVGQLQNLILFFLDLRAYGTFIPEIFSLWIFFLGYLVYQSGFLPRILGALLMVGGICYPLQAVLFLLFPHIDATILSALAFFSELLFYLWLLIKGVHVGPLEKITTEAI